MMLHNEVPLIAMRTGGEEKTLLPAVGSSNRGPRGVSISNETSSSSEVLLDLSMASLNAGIEYSVQLNLNDEADHT